MNNPAPLTLEEALRGSLLGQSSSAVIVFFDARGFSAFCKSHDSAEVAIYVSKLFLKIIDRFSGLSEGAFFKSTGDGLLMVFPYQEDQLEQLYREVVVRCLNCHESFADMLSDVRAINFEIPKAVGFSVVRGAVSALTSTETSGKRFVVDYAGHRINLAARLQDLARPSGVILEGSKDIEILEPELRERFEKADVFIRSVAETKSTAIWMTTGVRLDPTNLRPMEARWKTLTWEWKKASLSKLPGIHNFQLGKSVLTEGMIVRLKRPANPTHDAHSSSVYRNMGVGEDFSIEQVGENAMLRVKTKFVLKKYANIVDTCPDDGSLTIESIFQTLDE